MDNLKTLILGFTNHKDKQIKGQGHPCVFTAHLTFTGIHSETLGSAQWMVAHLGRLSST
jgi:hypothetical protein